MPSPREAEPIGTSPTQQWSAAKARYAVPSVRHREQRKLRRLPKQASDGGRADVANDRAPCGGAVANARAARCGVLVIFVQKVTLSKFLILLGNHSVSRATSLICFDLLLFVAVFVSLR